MTLSGLIVAAKLKEEIAVPSTLKNIEIENAEDFCRLSEANYLKSIHFKDDLIKILNTLVESSLPLSYFSLKFVKNANSKLQLVVADFDESL